MYLSHKYKFLFLRTPKTASSSLSDFFINNVDDPDAIYTEVEDSSIPGTLPESIVSRYRPYAFYHFTIEQLISEKVLTEEQAREYYCFALLREPLDRQKSLYYFYKKWKSPKTPASLDEYKSWAPYGLFEDPNSRIIQTDLLKIRGELVGEYWLYEDLDVRLNHFMTETLGLECPPLPQHKTDTRKDKTNEIEFDADALIPVHNYFYNDFIMYKELKHGQ